MSKRRRGPSRARDREEASRIFAEATLVIVDELPPAPDRDELAELLEEMAAALKVALDLDRVPCGMGDAVRIGRSYLHARGRPPGQIVRFVPATDPELGLE